MPISRVLLGCATLPISFPSRKEVILLIAFYGIKKRAGKKRVSRGHRIALIEGVRFPYGRKVVISDEFIEKTGLGDPAIRQQVKKSILINHGVIIVQRGQDDAVEPQITVPELPDLS